MIGRVSSGLVKNCLVMGPTSSFIAQTSANAFNEGFSHWFAGQNEVELILRRFAQASSTRVGISSHEPQG